MQTADDVFRRIDIPTSSTSRHLPDFDSCEHVAVAANGGPVALLHAGQLVVATQSAVLHRGQRREPEQLLLSAPWGHGGGANRVAAFGWTGAGTLACVLDDGHAVCYSSFQKRDPVVQALLPEQSRGARIVRALVWAGGVVVLTDAYALYAVTGLATPTDAGGARVDRLGRLPLARLPEAMAVLVPEKARRRPRWPEVLVSLPGQAGVLAAEGLENRVEPRVPHWQAAPVVALAAHPIERVVACFCIDGKLSVVKADFSELLFDVDAVSAVGGGGIAFPRQMCWCGSAFAVLTCWGPPAAGAMGSLLHGTLQTQRRAPPSSAARRQGPSFGADGLPHGVLLCGQGGASLQWGYANAVRVVEEVDGVRIVGPVAYHAPAAAHTARQSGAAAAAGFSVQLLQCVSPATESIFTVASQTPAAMLVYAVDALVNNRDPDADVTLQAIVDDGNMEVAVRECIAAALVEFDEQCQQKLLYAAAYGKDILCGTFREAPPSSHAAGGGSSNGAPYVGDGHGLEDAFDAAAELATAFVDAQNSISVLKVLRRFAGIPISGPQLAYVTAEVAINRLVVHHRHYLALKVCEFLGLQRVATDCVLVHWACAKLSAAPAEESDGDLFDTVRQRLHPDRYPNVRFSAIAAHAASLGRRTLALRLSGLETHRRQGVLLLLSICEYRAALEKACASCGGGDTDLICFAAAYTMRQLGAEREREFFALLLRPQCAAARRTMELYWHASARAGATNTLQRFREVAGRRQDVADLFAEQALVLRDFRKRRNLMLKAKEAYEAGGESDAKLKRVGVKVTYNADSAFRAEMATDHVRLMEMQEEMEPRLVGMSLAATITDCFRHREEYLHVWAERLRRAFKLKDVVFWKLQVAAVASRKAWGDLEALSRQKKLVKGVGLSYFAETCDNHGNAEEAMKYQARMPEEDHDRERCAQQ